MDKKLKCYSKGCEKKVEYQWFPNKNKGHLHICKEHFDLLSQVYYTEHLGVDEGIKMVRVVPESDDK